MSIKTGLEYVGYINPWTDEECLSDEEIVRCRDCKFCKLDPEPVDPGWPLWCEDSGRDMLNPDGFCAWGSRKEDA